jgi:hypothetical protein
MSSNSSTPMTETSITGTKAEEELREYLRDHCEAFRSPDPDFKPYLILQKPSDWDIHHRNTMSGGRVIRIHPIEAYGHYKVVR